MGTAVLVERDRQGWGKGPLGQPFSPLLVAHGNVQRSSSHASVLFELFTVSIYYIYHQEKMTIILKIKGIP